jgi:phosphate uptake regulator
LVIVQEKERRKVQISGKSSCMVALPKKWVKQMGLKQGAEIIITRHSPTSLIITPDAVAQPSENLDATIEVTEKDSPRVIFRKIVSLYVLGYSRITLRSANGFLSSSKKDVIKDNVRRHLIGTEGVADAKDRLTIHVLLGYSELSVDNALKKMLLIATSMQKDGAKALEDHDGALAEGVIRREDEVGRFGLYVIRQLNMSATQGIRDSALEPRDLLGYTMVAKYLERVAHHAATIANEVLNLKEDLQKAMLAKLAPMSENASELVDEAMLSLFKRDHPGADDVVEGCQRFVEEEMAVLKSLDGNDVEQYYAIHIIADSQKRIAEYARDIAEVVLDLTIERTIRKEEPITVRASAEFGASPER